MKPLVFEIELKDLAESVKLLGTHDSVVTLFWF